MGILTSFLKGEQNVVTNVEDYIEEYTRISLSILIVASCLINGMVLVTADEEHFRRIEDLEVENWLR